MSSYRICKGCGHYEHDCKCDGASGSLHRMVGRHIVHRATSPRSLANGQWAYDTEDRDVILMALKGKWAMVCRKGCIPYVADIREIVPPNEKGQR